MRAYSTKDVEAHCHAYDCWIILYDKVYDVTTYLQHHPGGSTVILNHAGTDATSIFESIHSKTILSILPKESLIGYIKRNDINKKSSTRSTSSILSVYCQNHTKYQSKHNYNFNNFSTVSMLKAQSLKIMKPRGLNYCFPGADDEITMRENQAIYSRIKLRPRPSSISNKHSREVIINLSCNMLNNTISSIPLFLCPTGLNKLFHPNGELSVINAFHEQNVK